MSAVTLTPPPQQHGPLAQPRSPSNGVLAQPDPLADAGPEPYRWTIAEYRELYETGLFCDKKTMLLDGVLYVMVMPKPPHDVGLSLTEDWLRGIVPPGHFVRNQMGFDIGLNNDPGPDLAVVAGTIRDYARKTPTTAALVIEISNTTLRLDTTKKVELYATAGVPEYWVLDVVGRKLIVHRDPEPRPEGLGEAAYNSRIEYAETDTVAPLLAPEAGVKVGDLLP